MSNYSGALTVVGYAVGTYFGYPQLGAVVGGVVGGVADYQNLPDNEGPRLGDAQTISAAYGDPIPWIAGAARVGGQVWWVSARREIGTTTEQGKGGGPKNTTYTYEQDVLFGLTSHEVGDVARIWLNGKLVWTQMPGADIESIVNSQESPLWSRLTIYTGEAGQLPDPTYEAAVGAGNAPAYRGRCSVMIEGLQLGTSGQMPNLTFEVVKNGLQTVFLDAPMTSNGLDTVAPAATTSASDPPTYTADGGYFTRAPGEPKSISFIVPSGGKLALTEVGKRGVWNLQADFLFQFNPVGGTGDNIRFFFTSSAQYGFSYQRVTGTPKLFAWINSSIGPIQVDLSRNLQSGKYRIRIDTSGPSAEWNVKWYLNNDLLLTQAISALGFTNIFIGFAAGNGAGVDAMTVSNFKVTAAGVGEVELGEPLQGVVEQLCDRAGMPSGSYDASALSTITKPVRSLLLAQLGAARAALQPLQLAYHFDCTLTDKLYFRPRATSAVANIPLDDLAAGVDKPSGEPFALTQGSDIELPAQVAVRYRNVENDYQTGVEVSDRLLSGQVAMQSIEVALGMTPSEAKALADVMVNDNLAALTRGTISLSMAYAHLQPADVVIIDGETMRLGRKQDARGVITFETRRHDASTILSAGVTDSSGYDSAAAVTAPSPTTLQVLDVPILRDADNGPGHYVAANGGATWAGASVQRSINNVDFSQAATVLERAVFGTCTTTLGNFAGIGFDEVNSVSVSVGTGELASSTRDALLLDQQVNVILIGGEVIRFVTATLTGTAPNRYKLTRLLRGQRGTEWAMASHVADERCVLLRPQGLRYIATPQADIGATRYIKGVTNGLNASTATGAAYVNSGVSQKPFAPTNLRASNDEYGNTKITWARRDRAIRPWGSLGMSEASESYEVDVYAATDAFVQTVAATTTSVAIGSFAIGGVYQSKLYFVGHWGGSIFASTADGRFVRLDATTKSITASIGPVGPLFATIGIAGNTGAIGIRTIIYDGAGKAYIVMNGEATFAAATSSQKLVAVDLANMTATATVDIFSLTSGIFIHGGVVVGTKLFLSGGADNLTTAKAAKVDISGLTVDATYSLGTMQNGFSSIAPDGSGGVCVFGVDGSNFVKLNSSLVETARYDLTLGGGYYCISTSGGIFFANGNGYLSVIDITSGALIEQFAFNNAFDAPIVDLGSEIVIQRLAITVNGNTTLLDPGECIFLDPSDGSILSTLYPDGYLLSGANDGYLICNEIEHIGIAKEFTFGAGLSGGRAEVYQISATVGRGYKAEIDL